MSRFIGVLARSFNSTELDENADAQRNDKLTMARILREIDLSVILIWNHGANRHDIRAV
ncbi:conserved hypothetical protein [Vibrio crassostreae]|nr:conserved hypothetical protein [Vibrio crassostreae]CAK2065618.1 conserved hypothetical protein [Vibrio crassostreae]CAK2070903.1 conserved hypothetical protein [Vibrio crassostreae]CAK2850652.1 conserved hypothetical protein [Vibrio crassostreae]CAK2945264.1 conserved hypothetical protein [Vibrio crassostreae]